MPIFTSRLIWSADSPKLSPSRLLNPLGLGGGGLASGDLDVVLRIPTPDSISIHSKTIRIGLDARNSDFACLRVNVSPVLVGLGVFNVVLEVNSVCCKNSKRFLCSLWKAYLALPGTTACCWDVIGNIFGNIIVEFGIPGGISKFDSVIVEIKDSGILGPFVEMKVLLGSLASIE